MVQRTTKPVIQPAVGRRGAREAGILDVAARLYNARGYERVSMADVAAAAGLSEGTLYNYFLDKSDLVLKVALASIERNVAEAERIAATATSLDSGLQALIAHQLRNMLAAPEIYRIWLREVKGAESYDKSRARAVLKRFSGHFNAFLDRWQRDDASGLDRGIIRDMLYGGIEQVGWTAALKGGRPAMDVDAIAHKLTHSYLAAFNAAASARPVSRLSKKTVNSTRHPTPRAARYE